MRFNNKLLNLMRFNNLLLNANFRKKKRKVVKITLLYYPLLRVIEIYLDFIKIKKDFL